MANHQRKINGSMRFRLPKLKRKTSRVSSSSSSSDNRRTSQPETSPKRSEAHHHHHSLQASHCAIEHSKPVSHRHHSTPLRPSRASPYEATSSSSFSKHQASSLDILSADVQLQVFSFLDLTALRKMMATNRAFRALLASDSAYKVWHAICLAKFAMHEYDSEHGIFLHDDFGLPIAAVSPNAFCRYNRVNLPLLLSMTPHHVPTGMADEHSSDNGTIDAYSYLPSLIQVFSDDEEESTTDDGERGPPHLDTSFESTSSLSSSFDVRLHYNGNVGSGQVYSVKANHPLPKPTLQLSPNKKNKNKKSKMRLLKNKNKSSSEWNPMVIPYNSLHDAPRLIHVTPRLVSYFEISITAAAPEPETRRPVRFDHVDGPRIQDCVVIGLATQAFCPRGTLPGWDLTSFGYHSDNGGLYHGSGHARQRTESFGPGDTVGMGVDYVTKTIFVTKNGRFLGSAYDVFTTEFLATMDLYPVVGMDSKDTVHVNYGGIDHPFHFNLASYCHRQQQNSKFRIATKFQFTQDSNGVQVGC